VSSRRRRPRRPRRRASCGSPVAITDATYGGNARVAPVSRSLVVGDRLYTLSWPGLQAAALDTPAPLHFVAFATP
jgi:hypothetical protein